MLVCLVLLKAFSAGAIATWSSTDDRKRVDWLLLPAPYVCWWVNLRVQALIMTPTWAVIGNRVVMGNGFVVWWEPYGLLTSQHHHYYWAVTTLESRARTKTKMGRGHSNSPTLSGRVFWRSITWDSHGIIKRRRTKVFVKDVWYHDLGAFLFVEQIGFSILKWYHAKLT